MINYMLLYRKLKYDDYMNEEGKENIKWQVFHNVCIVVMEK